MKRSLMMSVVAALAVVSGAAVVTAGQEKVEVCHVNGAGSYLLIEIADPAFDAHVAHGDARPGDPVPDMPGYVFDAYCIPRQAMFAVAYTDVDGVDGFDPVAGDVLIAKVVDANGTGCLDGGDEVVMGQYPVGDFDTPRFETFQVSKHPVGSYAGGPNHVVIRSGKYLEFVFSVFREGGEQYYEHDSYVSGTTSRWVDHPAAGSDVIQTTELSPSGPQTHPILSRKANYDDDPFIEVRIFGVCL